MPGRNTKNTKSSNDPSNDPESLNTQEVLEEQQHKKQQAIDKVSKTKDKSKIKSSTNTNRRNNTIIDSDLEEAERGPVHYTSSPVTTNGETGNESSPTIQSAQGICICLPHLVSRLNKVLLNLSEVFNSIVSMSLCIFSHTFSIIFYKKSKFIHLLKNLMVILS